MRFANVKNDTKKYQKINRYFSLLIPQEFDIAQVSATGTAGEDKVPVYLVHYRPNDITQEKWKNLRDELHESGWDKLVRRIEEFHDAHCVPKVRVYWKPMWEWWYVVDQCAAV